VDARIKSAQDDFKWRYEGLIQIIDDPPPRRVRPAT
jgi:hypothetical protein